MKKVVFTVIFQFLAVAYSDSENEVKSISELHMAIVHIFDTNNIMLCIGVLTKEAAALTHRSCLGSLRNPIIKFPGKDVEHSTFILCYYKDIAVIQFTNGIFELNKPDVKFSTYYGERPSCSLYASTIGWKQGRKLMREILIIKTVTKYEIKTKPSVGQSDDYEGHIGDPLFYGHKLVGILARVENKTNIYANVAKSVYSYSDGNSKIAYHALNPSLVQV